MGRQTSCPEHTGGGRAAQGRARLQWEGRMGGASAEEAAPAAFAPCSWPQHLF